MALKNRIEKLEQGNKPSGFVVLVVNDNETSEEAYQRCFSDSSIRPKMVVYVNPVDVRL